MTRILLIIWASLPRRSLGRPDAGTDLVWCESSHPYKISTHCLPKPVPHPLSFPRAARGKSLKQEPVSEYRFSHFQQEGTASDCLASVKWGDSFLLMCLAVPHNTNDVNGHRSIGDTWKGKGLAGDVVPLVECLLSLHEARV